MHLVPIFLFCCYHMMILAIGSRYPHYLILSCFSWTNCVFSCVITLRKEHQTTRIRPRSCWNWNQRLRTWRNSISPFIKWVWNRNRLRDLHRKVDGCHGFTFVRSRIHTHARTLLRVIRFTWSPLFFPPYHIMESVRCSWWIIWSVDSHVFCVF